MVCPNQETLLLEKRYLEARIQKIKKDNMEVPESLTRKLKNVDNQLSTMEEIIEETEKVLDETEIAIIGD
jgi:phosphopantothenoylcysteine synthetase/decarboxylase